MAEPIILCQRLSHGNGVSSRDTGVKQAVIFSYICFLKAHQRHCGFWVGWDCAQYAFVAYRSTRCWWDRWKRTRYSGPCDALAFCSWTDRCAPRSGDTATNGACNRSVHTALWWLVRRI